MNRQGPALQRRTTAALMYHDIVTLGAEDSSGFPGRDAARYKVTPERFAEHLRAITTNRRPDRSEPLITFDDGGISALTAATLLERYGLRGHFFLTANYIGTRRFLDERDIRDLHGRGHSIGSHSCSHPLRMGHCSPMRLVDEWMRSRDVISDIVGEAVAVGSVPGGDYAPAVAEAAARAGFAQLFTSEPTDHIDHACGLELRGRFTIYRWTATSTVEGLARCSWLPRARQAVAWNARKMSKRIAGKWYLQIRRLLLRYDATVEWGDSEPGKSQV